jgi:copper homeostasis protein (lipoprotein)
MNTSTRFALLALCLATVARASGSTARGAAPSSPLGSLPASFAGTVPCADCAGTRYQLDVLPRAAFVQRLTYLRNGRDETYYSLGTWSVSSDGKTLVLDGGREGLGYWAIRDARTLRKLDAQGEPIVSSLPYELQRTTGLPLVEPRLRLQGMFRTRADAPRFRDCASNLEWPVARTDDYPTLERAYVEKRTAPDAELRVSIDARIERRARAGSTTPQPTLVVEHYVRATPGDTCESRRVQPELENTRWRPLRIGERAVTVSGQEREPWLVLEPQAKRVTGSGGCNRFSGTYEAGAGTLTFGPLMSTRMACPGLETETAFLKALEGTRRFRVAGRHMDLEDAKGVVLMRLEERNLK